MTKGLDQPIHVFRFELSLAPTDAAGGKPGTPETAGFAECTGLEATMEPKVIKEGGRNYGAVQRAGPVTFGTVVLKRGITGDSRLWDWFAEATQRGFYAERQDVTITINNSNVNDTSPVQKWRLVRALPIKLKVPDLNARASEVGIEELHLTHEGMLKA
ncbi:MAG: phage tail protein [Gemmatimonadales bacterium]